MVIYEADISEKDDDGISNKKLYISKLTLNELKKLSKKANFQIILINQFASSNNQQINELINLGIVQNHQRNYNNI